MSDVLLNNTRNAKLFVELVDEDKVYLRRYAGLLRNYVMPWVLNNTRNARLSAHIMKFNL